MSEIEKREGVRMVEKSEYGNWVSKRLIYETAAIGLIFLGLSILLRVLVVPGFLSFLASYWFLFLIPAGLSLCFSVYFMYARYQFAPRGGNVQNKVLELLLAFGLERKGTSIGYRLWKRPAHHQTCSKVCGGSDCRD